MTNKIAYLPCELRARDFSPRCLLTAKLLDKGIKVYLGNWWSVVNQLEAPPGVFFFTTCNTTQARAMRAVRASNSIVVACDEESLPFIGDRFLQNIDPDAISHMNKFLCINEEQAKVMERFKVNQAVTGSIRVELMNKALYKQRPTKESYVLFNTSFGLINSVWGDLGTATKILISGGGIDLKTQEGRQELKNRIEYEIECKDIVLKLIEYVRTMYPELDVVIRPHPVENPKSWETVQGVTVITGADPLPWIANAEKMIHCNSTSGIEAFALGTECINIVSEKFTEWTSHTKMSRLNLTVHTLDAAEVALRSVLDYPERTELDCGVRKRCAENVANELIAFMNGDNFNKSFEWRSITRTDAMKNKFTCTRDEVINRVCDFTQTHFQCAQVDDSTFCLTKAV